MKYITDRVEQILVAEATAIMAVKVGVQFETVINRITDGPGKVVTTGMGKAGHVARKFAATLCSTGTPAVYLHPGEASHGDLGIIEVNDVMIAFSTSGKTREVLDVLTWGRGLGLECIIGITSHPDSDFGILCDVVIDMGIIKEPCPLKLTPTASTTVMMAIADAIALVVMELKSITTKDFAMRHHAGYLGQVAKETQ